ncbi:MAG: hypothetical protein Q8N79_00050 [Candidatus Methanoperedens sp.]|nr:hypothetical protein [Candidatus Methanoperedens sp.]
MNNESKIGLLVLGAVIIGIVLGVFLVQNVTGEIREVSSAMKNLETSMKGIDASLKEVKTTLAEKETGQFRREMQESGRRILSLNYAGKFANWDAAKKEVDELDGTLKNAADLRPDLAQTIQSFRNAYILGLKGAADKKDTKNFETVWNDTYNACIACHRGAGTPPEAAKVLGEIKIDVEFYE